MKVLVTGANGFLGYYLCEQLLKKGYDVIATGKGPGRLPFTVNEKFHYETMDFTDPFSVHDVFEKHRPYAVVHAGAVSKPDDCELKQWEAYTVNTEGTITLLLNSEEYKSFFVFVSTDFVFDGESGMYTEDDLPAPVNFYGKTKLEAEQGVMEYAYDWSIVRTVLVYGKPQSGRSNLLTIMKSKLEKGEEYKVVDDQIRTPTYVEDLASAIVTVIDQRATGIFHISGDTVLTPYQMAIQAANFLGLDASLIQRVTASDFSQPAKRPPKTGFIIEKARKQLNFQPISFEEGLRRTFEGHSG